MRKKKYSKYEYTVFYGPQRYYVSAKNAAEAKRKAAHEIQRSPYEDRTIAEIMKWLKAKRDYPSYL